MHHFLSSGSDAPAHHEFGSSRQRASTLGDLLAYQSAFPRVGTFEGTLNYAGGAPGTDAMPGLPGLARGFQCSAGYEFVLASLSCMQCGIGFWSNGTSDRPCAVCTNAPPLGSYTGTTDETPDCEYTCPSGTRYPSCKTPVEELIAAFGGSAGFISATLSFLAFLLIVAVCLCRWRLAENESFKYSEGGGGVAAWRRRGGCAGALFGASSSTGWGRGRSMSTGGDEQLLLGGGRGGGKSSSSSISGGAAAASSYGATPSSSYASVPSGGADSALRCRSAAVTLLRGLGSGTGTGASVGGGRLSAAALAAISQHAERLSDAATLDFLMASSVLQASDLPAHDERIYFGGSNELASSWRLPWTAPPRLRRVLREAEYAELAAFVNELVHWPRGGWEEVFSLVLSALALPAASAFLQWRGRVRVARLLQAVLGRPNSHSVLRCARASALGDSLRVGVSEDGCLAYIDVLSAQAGGGGGGGSSGAPPLPLTFLFAGNGSASRPFFLDGNDALLRAVPSVPGLSRFIDNDWVEFVAAVNERARLVCAGAEVQTLGPLLALLACVNDHSDLLGGLEVQLVRYWPCAQGFAEGLREGSSGGGGARRQGATARHAATMAAAMKRGAVANRRFKLPAAARCLTFSTRAAMMKASHRPDHPCFAAPHPLRGVLGPFGAPSPPLKTMWCLLLTQSWACLYCARARGSSPPLH